MNISLDNVLTLVCVVCMLTLVTSNRLKVYMVADLLGHISLNCMVYHSYRPLDKAERVPFIALQSVWMYMVAHRV
jgi:hypothetical protein